MPFKYNFKSGYMASISPTIFLASVTRSIVSRRLLSGNWRVTLTVATDPDFEMKWFTKAGSFRAIFFMTSIVSLFRISVSLTRSLIINSSFSAIVCWKFVIESTLLE